MAVKVNIITGAYFHEWTVVAGDALYVWEAQGKSLLQQQKVLTLILSQHSITGGPAQV